MKEKEISYRYDYSDFHIDYLSARWDEAILRAAPPHIHNRAELLFVEHGCSAFIANDSIYHARGRYIIYVPSDCVHEQINKFSNDYYSRYCLCLTPTDIGLEEYSFPDVPFMFELDEAQFASMLIIIDALYKFHEMRSTPANDVDLSRRKSLLIMLQNELKPLLSKHLSGVRTDVIGLKNGYIGSICLYINEHYHEKLSLDALASEHFISRSKLTRDFRAAMNMSIGDYITAVRINKSIPRLLDRMPISELARSCGFSSSSHYIRCFCKWSNQTPAKYRENHSRMLEDNSGIQV